MPRTARIVLADQPHHVVQRGAEIMTQCKNMLKNNLMIIKSELKRNTRLDLRNLNVNKKPLSAICSNASRELKKDLAKLSRKQGVEIWY